MDWFLRDAICQCCCSIVPQYSPHVLQNNQSWASIDLRPMCARDPTKRELLTIRFRRTSGWCSAAVLRKWPYVLQSSRRCASVILRQIYWCPTRQSHQPILRVSQFSWLVQSKPVTLRMLFVSALSYLLVYVCIKSINYVRWWNSNRCIDTHTYLSHQTTLCIDRCDWLRVSTCTVVCPASVAPLF